jgi:hypothetical protein
MRQEASRWVWGTVKHCPPSPTLLRRSRAPPRGIVDVPLAWDLRPSLCMALYENTHCSGGVKILQVQAGFRNKKRAGLRWPSKACDM